MHKYSQRAYKYIESSPVSWGTVGVGGLSDTLFQHWRDSFKVHGPVCLTVQ